MIKRRKLFNKGDLEYKCKVDNVGLYSVNHIDKGQGCANIEMIL